MSRYAAICRRCNTADELEHPNCPISVVVGWDAERETYFAQVEDQSIEVPEDADASMSLVLWVGKWPHEVTTVEELERLLAPYAALAANVRDRLEDDRVDGLLGLRR